jgi:hypothetical protein
MKSERQRPRQIAFPLRAKANHRLLEAMMRSVSCSGASRSRAHGDCTGRPTYLEWHGSDAQQLGLAVQQRM